MTDPLAGRTIETARRMLAERLKASGIETPELDARILIGATLALDLTSLMEQAARRLTVDEADRLVVAIRRRAAGEPVARIIGVREFWGLPLRLSAATLVPRPDTETLVEAALEFLRAEFDRHNQPRIADIGTGSGAILLAILSEIHDATGVGTDISADALRAARANAERLGMARRTGFVVCDYMAALRGPFDLVVSNPPYIRSTEIAALESEVRDHDPRLALDGGTDGLDGYRAITPQARQLLAPGGALIVEIGRGQSSDVEALMVAAGLTTGGEAKADLSGIPRVVIGRNSP